MPTTNATRKYRPHDNIKCRFWPSPSDTPSSTALKMTKKPTKEAKQPFNERVAKEMAETADAMLRLGIMTESDHKLTMRDLNRVLPPESPLPLSGADIRGLREKANISQAVFARYLNLTAAHLSKLERGAKHPTGAALVLLNVIRRRGLEVIL